MAQSLGGSIPSLDWESNDLPREWKNFQTHAEFMFAGPLKNKSEEEKCSFLMLWVGNKGRDIYGTWALTAEQKKSLSTLCTKFKDYVEPKSNKVFARYQFQCIVQGEGDTCDQFITALKVKVKDCGYEKEDEMVRDRIVFGVRSAKVREKLIMQGSDLTLENAIDIARMYEQSQAQLKSMTAEDPKLSVNAIGGGKSKVLSTKQSTQRHGTGTFVQKRDQSQNCGRCGHPKHLKGEKCPAMGSVCHKCSRPDHFSRMCRTPNPRKDPNRKFHRNDTSGGRKIHQIDTSDSESDDELFLGMLTLDVNTVDADDKWSAELNVSETPVTFQLDTGAKCNVITRETYNALDIAAPLSKPDTPLKSYSGHKIHTEGTAILPVQHNGKNYQLKLYVVDVKSPNILGEKSCTDMNLVQRVQSVTQHDAKSVNSDNILSQPEYDELFKGLGCLPGEHSIKLDKSVTPTVQPPRKIPVALRDKVRDELTRMESLGVIVKENEPTPWVNSMVVVNKGSKIRICIDPKDLNNAIMREHYPLRTIDEVIANMPNAKYFSKLDAVTGFWQIRLDEASSKLCTFNTPYGRYRFTRMPFGIKSAPEVFQKVMSQMVLDIEGAEAIIDDILVLGATQEEHDQRLKRVLDRSKEYNLKLNRGKCEIKRTEVKYVGHLLTAEGVKPDPEKIRAVETMKKPENKQELLTFLGFIQYLGKFMPRMSDVSSSLRKLTEDKVSWHWTREHDVSFNCLKAMATNTPVLRYYDPKLPLTLSVDASSKGLGAVIMQDGQPIAYGSRALTASQQNYAQIEKEALAVVYGCQKFHHYVYGRPVLVESDHKPLQAIFSKPLLQAPMRLQRLLLAIQKYDLTVQYKPGKLMFVADTLSRSFLDETKEELVPDLEVNSVFLNSHLPVSPNRYSEFQLQTANDPDLQLLQKTVQSGWPENKEYLPANLHPYWNFRDEIICNDGLLFKGNKLIIPKSMQQEMLDLIHEPHLGVVKSKSRAREVIFWPGMSSQIEDKVSKCQVCATIQNSNPKEPMVCTDLPDRPWSKIASDIFTLDQSHYLLTVDYYSKWPEIVKMTELTAKYAIAALKSQFAKYGIPDELITDNGPQYACKEFREFSKEYGFVHNTSSPLYPRSNGQAERMVQTVKRLLKKSSDPYKSLMCYRNTQIEGLDQSPAQLFLGRRLKTSLPTSAELLRPSHTTVKEKLQKRQQIAKYYYDQKVARRPLPEIKVGDTVMMKDENAGKSWKHVKVEEKHSSPRSFIVSTSARKYRRNRSMLKPTRSVAPTENDEDIPTYFDAKVNAKDSAKVEIPKCDPPLNPPQPASPVVTLRTRSGRAIRKPSRYSED